jgi:hypothetical protein
MKFPEYSSAVVNLVDRSKQMKARVFEIRKSQSAWTDTQKTLRKHGSRKSNRIEKKQKKSEQLEFSI